jgi:TolB-like protein
VLTVTSKPRVWPTHWVIVAVALGLSLVVLAVWLFHSRGLPPTGIRSLAVLPLDNLSGDPTQDYFADGMTDALITDLAQIRALRVISRTSVMGYKGVRKPLPEIARELNVDAVVEGTVLRSGDQVRITAQLIQAPADKHLWAESYEGNLRDTLALQKEVARNIAERIRIEVTPQEQAALKSAKAIDPEAYEAYLKGDTSGTNGPRTDLRRRSITSTKPLPRTRTTQRLIADWPTHMPYWAIGNMR